MAMLRLSVRDEEFLMIGDDVKIVFLRKSVCVSYFVISCFLLLL